MHARFDFRTPQLPDGGLCFPSFEQVISATTLAEVRPALARVEELCLAGFYAAGFLSYEAAPAFDPALPAHLPYADLPLLWFGLSRTPTLLPATEPTMEEDARAEERAGGWFGDWQPLWDAATYEGAFRQVQAAIRAGESYQVNLTFPQRASFRGDPMRAYQQLRRAQQGDYAAFLDLGDRQILSLSPELFFQRHGNHIRTMPMKGTAPRGLYPAADEERRQRLRNSEKERAENLMIVDLLRNDLGRIATTGSVSVTSLLDARRYPTLWQLTSTIEAELPSAPRTGLCEIFAALFPCGSVTGAPKASSMRIIRSLEPESRGVYCGALGVILPGGDCVFNVPIRTLFLQEGQARYHTGGGLVSDGEPQREYAECALKARILSAEPANFELLETLLWQPQSGYVLLEEHLQRLQQSAEAFFRPCDPGSIRTELQRAIEGKTSPMRVRLLLQENGHISIMTTEHHPMPDTPVPVRLASGPVQSSDRFLYHKTTRRAVYDTFRTELNGAFEVLLYNERGELTEGTITNLAVRLNGVWYTPPVESGLLAGVQRRHLLERGQLQERVLQVSDLTRAEGLQVFNSLRGVLPAYLQQ